MKSKIVIGVDFDGTLATMYESGKEYIPKREINQKPNYEVVKFLKSLSRRKYKIIIYSSRWWGDYNWVKKWLDKYKIPYDDIILGKFKADVYLDDVSINPSVSGWQKKFFEILP
ncbi:MAG: hypothetical protein NZ870_04820 [bacterium]|nr:hypothetical protein [bacterium]